MLSTVTAPVQVVQFMVGPPLGSSATFHVTTDLAQFRVPPMIRCSVCQSSESANVLAGLDDCEPEHSVKYASLAGYASWTVDCASGSPP